MKKVTLVMLALAAVMQLPAQEQGRTLSLEEALEMTLSDNPAIRAAEFNRRAAQQERRAAVLSGNIGEAPHVADADGASGAHQQEAQPGAEGFSLHF